MKSVGLHITAMDHPVTRANDSTCMVTLSNWRHLKWAKNTDRQ